MNTEYSGVLLINKAGGMTSHDVVNRIRRLYKTRQVGHTGTLDPLATGVLPILVGRAVKASEYLVSDSKIYRAGMLLGRETDTEDITGEIKRECDDIPSDQEVEETAKSFIGEYFQTPPMYSALKVGGKKLCDLAREGKEIERTPRLVRVFDLEIKKSGEREFEIKTKVSKGTYIRTLLSDIGKKLLCGATMSSLERVASGDFTLEHAYTLDEIENMSEEERGKVLLAPESLFSTLDRITFPEFYEKLFKNGQEIYFSRANIAPRKLGERLRVYDRKDRFLALAEVREFPSGLAVKSLKFF